jgi:hypothetical protein
MLTLKYHTKKIPESKKTIGYITICNVLQKVNARRGIGNLNDDGL